MLRIRNLHLVHLSVSLSNLNQFKASVNYTNKRLRDINMLKFWKKKMN